MSPNRAPRTPAPAPAPAPQRDWPAQAADTIVEVVGKAHQKTTGPARTASRGLVFGLLIAIVAFMAAILVVVGLVRLLNNWLDVWLTYMVLGALFVLVGFLMYRQRSAMDDQLEGSAP